MSNFTNVCHLCFTYLGQCSPDTLTTASCYLAQIESRTEKVGKWCPSFFEVILCQIYFKTIGVAGRRDIIAQDVTQLRGVLAGYLTDRGGA